MLIYVCMLTHVCTHRKEKYLQAISNKLYWVYILPNRYIESACYVCSTIQGAGNMAVSKIQDTLFPMGLTFQKGEAESG